MLRDGHTEEAMTETFLALVGGLILGQAASLENLDFGKGSLHGWEGKGFVLTKDRPAAVSSQDELNPARKGMIRYVLRIPSHARAIRFQAYLLHPPEHQPDGRLDVVLAGDKSELVPKLVRTSSGWSPTPKLLVRWQGKPREYKWDVSAHSGRLLQIVIYDQDERTGCHVYCTGFTVETATPAVAEASADREFAQFMARLEKEHKLAPMARFDSKRFTALGNASESFMVQRLRNCEAIYDLFFDHFTRKGFVLHHPRQRLMLAIFDTPEGFEAYLGRKMPWGVTGLYHPATNRLVFYDQSQNRIVLEDKKQAHADAARFKSALDRARFITGVERKLDEWTKDLNLTTVMHEAAHQLSFNCGLLQRGGDVPIWLAEGLACYCEVTERAEWQALGAVNLGRIEDLKRTGGRFLSLQSLLTDEWRDGSNTHLAYAQSWALFRMLLQERPRDMQAYLTQIKTRRTSDHRLADFRQAFGKDLVALEMQHHAYLRDLVQTYAR